MKNCGTCQHADLRPTGEGLCYNPDAHKYAEEIDYHYEKCDNFEPLNQMFCSEIWDLSQF